MKTLIIHPKDKSTDFLKPIYEKIPYKTIITGGIHQNEVHKEMMLHDRVIMLGHGSPSGLFNVSDFKGCSLVVNERSVPFLKGKENIYIWCNADKFVEAHGLGGFYSGMFISELSEAIFCKLSGVTLEQIECSNNLFSELVGLVANNVAADIHAYTQKHYSDYADLVNCDVARYNQERLYFQMEKSVGKKIEK